MSEEKFDAIIVGGGLAGATAAYILANAGMEVLLADRGDFCGSKNVTGGRLYAHSLEKVFPGFAEEAPIERKVTHEKISLMTPKSSLDIGFSSEKLGEDPESASYTILHSKFDPWLAEKCEEAGVMLVPGIRVDSCVVEDGKVVGIDAGGEIMYSDVVIIADGVNSLLAQKLGMKKELTPHEVAVGVKEVIKLDEEVINQRFGVRGNEGVAWLSAGDATAGAFGGGLLYTNQDTISIGIVATLADIGYTDISIPDLLDRYKEHPAIKPYIEGGETIEYSAHLVPEAGVHMIPELVRDGVLVTGDAAGFVVNLGFTVRGMDFAVESGRLAAEAVIRAKEAGDFSKEGLSSYVDALNESFIMKDMKALKGFPAILSRREVFKDLPEMVDDICTKLFTVSGKPSMDFIMYVINSMASHLSVAQLTSLVGDIMDAF